MAPPPLPQRRAVPPPLPTGNAPRAIESSSEISAEDLLEPEELTTLRPGPKAPAPAVTAAPDSNATPLPVTAESPRLDPCAQSSPVSEPRLSTTFRPRRARRSLLQGLITGMVASAILALGLIAIVHLTEQRTPSERTVSRAVSPTASHTNPVAPPTPGSPRVVTPRDPTMAAATPATTPAATPAATPAVLDLDRSGMPASTSSAPTCEALLGGALDPKLDAQAANRETLRGKRQLVLGDADAAQTSFCRVALSRPHNVDGLLNLAQLLVVRRDGVQAADWAKRALALDPHNRRGLATLGDALVRAGNVDEARAAWLAAENRAEPHGADLELMIRRDLEEAQRMLQVRDLARAERVFRRVLAFDPKNAVATAGVAKCLRLLGATDEARAWDLRAQSLAG